MGTQWPQNCKMLTLTLVSSYKFGYNLNIAVYFIHILWGLIKNYKRSLEIIIQSHHMIRLRTLPYYVSQFSRSGVSDSLRLHGLQHTRPPCPLPSPRACSNSCPSSRWCHPTISSSVVPFSSCPQSFPASGSFQMSQFFTSGGQSVGASASASVLAMNIQDWSPLGWTGWISLQSKGLSRVFSNTTVQKHQFFGTQLSLWSNFTSIYDFWKNHLDRPLLAK